jgi:hypothetical protein
LLINRKSHVLNKMLPIIHKSLFGEAAAKSDCARAMDVHEPGKTSNHQKRAWQNLEDGLFEQQSKIKLVAVLRSKRVVQSGITVHNDRIKPGAGS